MKRLAALLWFPVLTASPALATEWLNCAAEGGKAEMNVLLGLTDYVAVDTVNISVGKKTWSNKKGQGISVAVSQAYQTSDMTLIDVADNDGAQVGQLRIFTASEGEDSAYGGVLRIVNEGAWPVSCSGP
ncbi:hypothetical protein [Aestuariivirga sp.]|uniref:hypothetical protein n=1 Tax=Aestuariivirga sp. TaxID=2650926 RepID=UPI0039E5DC22